MSPLQRLDLVSLEKHGPLTCRRQGYNQEALRPSLTSNARMGKVAKTQ